MTRLGARLAALALLLLGVLWGAPLLVDWDAWRAPIAAFAAARLDRPVALDGPIAVRLLPRPEIEAARVTLGAGADGVRAEAGRIRLGLRLAPLLLGRIEPHALTLSGGALHLPWPPVALPGLRPPPWLAALEARLEGVTLVVAGLRLEGLDARLATGGAEALSVTGGFALAGRRLRVSARLGRAGLDGAAPLDIGLTASGGSVAVQGVLHGAGGFSGRLDAAGGDLATLAPAPAAPFAARGRLRAGPDLVALEDVALELAGQAARGAVVLRLDPEPRLELALQAGRIDLSAWVAALRTAPAPTLPMALDLSVEAARLGTLPLRRLRLAWTREVDAPARVTATALLPGDTEVAAAGNATGAELDLAIRFAGQDLRPLLVAAGLPPPPDPARFRVGEGRFRLALRAEEAAASELVAVLDGARIAGGGAFRWGARPSLGLGLEFDRLDLDGLWPLTTPPAGLELNLRLAAELVRWRGIEATRATLDAGQVGERLVLRRLGLRVAELDLAAAGTAHSSRPGWRFADVAFEAAGLATATQLALLPPAIAALWPSAGEPVALRIAGGGPAEALALRIEGDLGALRLEASGTLDSPASQGSGSLTLRHPGAPRLLAPLLGPGAAEWLGEGSFALITGFGAGPEGLVLDGFDLTAGGVRAQGRLALALGGARPVLTGRIAAERLSLPGWPSRGDAPFGFAALGTLDADLALAAAQLDIPGLPPLTAVAAQLRLVAARLRLDAVTARVAGGCCEGGCNSTPPPNRRSSRLRPNSRM